MYKNVLEIRFLSDWHVGSGLGDGAIADAVLTRDAYGIPVIPGTAIKGALREGAWRLALALPEYAALPDCLFGTASSKRVSNQPGLLAFERGQLDGDLRKWLRSRGDLKEFIQDMTLVRQQTRLDANKIVESGSLRSTEFGIPGLVFTSSVAANLPESVWPWLENYLAAICACVKSIGGYRSRGIGRCRIELAGAKAATMPGPLPAGLATCIAKGRQDESSRVDA